MSVTTEQPMQRGNVAEVARIFLRLGFTAFGGPAAHIAMMRREFVQQRQWLSDEHFVDLIGAVNLIPGPNSTELGMYIGYVRAGWLGLLVAGACFIGPAMGIVLGFAWVYVTYGSLPAIGWIFYGLKPVVVAIIAQALWGLGRTALKGWLPVVFGVGVVALYLIGVNEIVLLFGTALAYGLIQWVLQRQRPARPTVTAALLAPAWWMKFASGSVIGTIIAGFSQLTLLLTFLKIGATLYGSGYVLLAFLRDEFVIHLHWLTDRQLIDAVSVGQFTPGPVFTTATFIGYLIGGVPGAFVATLGIFLPSFIFVALIHPVAARLRRYPFTALLLAGVNVAAIAFIAGVIIQLQRTALVDPLTWAIALLSLFILLRWQINSFWLIVAGAIIGVIAQSIR